MSKLKNSECVYLAGLRFEYNHRGCLPTVTVYDAMRTHNKIATFNTELLTTLQDLQMEAAWWVYENNPHAL